MKNIFVSDLTVYRPPVENPAELPKLEFCDPLFKRRLSQVSRMTIQVVHDLIQKNPLAKDCKLIFASFRGELSRQLKINKGLVEDGDVMPAQFSISVFNTPPASATIACGMKAGYTAVYPSQDKFNDALLAAAAPVLAGSEKQVVFVYADEFIIDEYRASYRASDDSCLNSTEPLAFACILSSAPGQKCLDLSKEISCPQQFLDLF